MKTFKNIIKSTKYSIKLLNSKLLNNKFKFNKYSSFVSIKLQIHDSNNKFDSTWGSKPEWFGSANPIKIKQNSHSNNKHMVYQIKKYYGQINNRYNCHYNNNYMCNQIREYSGDNNNSNNNDTNNNDKHTMVDHYHNIGLLVFVVTVLTCGGSLVYEFLINADSYDLLTTIICGPVVIGLITAFSVLCGIFWPIVILWTTGKCISKISQLNSNPK